MNNFFDNITKNLDLKLSTTLIQVTLTKQLNILTIISAMQNKGGLY